MTYAKLLYQLPVDRLREIIRRRSRALRTIPRIEGKRELCQFLAEALSAPASVTDALRGTDFLQLQILTFAITQGGTVTFDMLAAQLGEDARQRLWTAANELEACGLLLLTHFAHETRVVGSDRALFVPGAVRETTPLPLPLRHTLPKALDLYDASIVGVLYQTLGLPSSTTTKTARMNAISEMLTDTECVQAVVAGLTDTDRAVLQYVLDNGGATSLSQLAQRLDSRHRNQLYSYDWAMRWYHGKPRNPVEELLTRGLLIMDGAVGWGYGHILIPGNVLAAITGRPLFAGGAARMPEWETIQASTAAVRKHDSLCRDIAYLMGFLGRTEATRTSKGNIHRTVLKNLAKSLTVSSPEYAAFVYAIARESDLIAPQGRQSMYDVTEQGLAWLEMPVEEQLKNLYSVWRVQTAWSEIADDPLTEGATFYFAEETRSYRECAASLLKELRHDRPGELASLDSLTARAQFKWWSRFPRGTATEELNEGAGTVAGRVLDQIIAGSLHWMGLTDVVTGSQGGVAYVRLSERGNTALGGEESASTEGMQTVDTFIVQPNLEIYTPPNLSPSLLYRLFRIAEPSSRAGSLLVLTKETLRKALDRGETADGILALFRERSQTGVPQNVEYLINEMGGKHGHIHIGQAGIYIQVSDPMLLKEIQAQKKLNIHFRRQLTDTVALVTGDSMDSILKQLRQAGYLPVSDEEKHASAITIRPPKHPYQPPPVVKSKQADTEGRIDWKAVEAEEGEPWDHPAVESAPLLQTDAPLELRKLIMRSIDERLCLSICYQPDARASTAEREVEPIGFAGSLLRAYDRGKLSNILYNIRYITYARATGERFEKR